MATSVSQRVRKPHARLVSAVCVFLLFGMPLAGFAEDEQSIATLRQMGRAFASIAEKASPAVVGIQATQVVKAGSSSQGRSYGDPSNPFEEELFKYFFDISINIY